MEEAAELYQRGQELLGKRQIVEALHCFNAAERSGFALELCAASRWDCWMLTGQFDRAWAESDRIAQTGAPDPHRFWNGLPWNGQRLMLRCLHGLGDTIQFIRYAPLLRSTCEELTVQTHPQLTTLLHGVRGVDRVVTWGPNYVEDPASWDLQMEVNELPRAFRATTGSLPADTPYIHIPQSKVEWAAGCFPHRTGFRIGLCWQSGPWDSTRSIPVSEFEPLLRQTQYQIFNLQKGAEITSLCPLEKYASDIRDTAALILNLDLVITVDTMTAHLAGALGRPVWILLPFIADWRWMLSRRDTPWYPTARLFRQPKPGDWSTVIAEVTEAVLRYESGGGDLSDLQRPTNTCTPPLLVENP